MRPAPQSLCGYNPIRASGLREFRAALELL